MDVFYYLDLPGHNVVGCRYGGIIVSYCVFGYSLPGKCVPGLGVGLGLGDEVWLVMVVRGYLGRVLLPVSYL